jgi:8-oxo-dGTP pyrophosphatase MutT (NUDIX family)
MIKKLAFSVVGRCLNLYWKIFRPKTYGVKAIILHPQQKHCCLVVQHTYGNTEAWNLPGGGYSPKKEAEQEAIAREIKEEVGVDCQQVDKLGEYYTEAQSKRDTVSIFVVTPASINFNLNSEIKNTDWRNIDELTNNSYYKIVRHAAQLYQKKFMH